MSRTSWINPFITYQINVVALRKGLLTQYLISQNLCFSRTSLITQVTGLSGLAQGGEAEKGAPEGQGGLRAVSQHVLMVVPSWGQQSEGSRVGGQSYFRLGEEEKLLLRLPGLQPGPTAEWRQEGSDLKTDHKTTLWNILLLIQCPWSCAFPSSIPDRVLSDTWFFFFLTNAAESIKKKFHLQWIFI